MFFLNYEPQRLKSLESKEKKKESKSLIKMLQKHFKPKVLYRVEQNIYLYQTFNSKESFTRREKGPFNIEHF